MDSRLGVVLQLDHESSLGRLLGVDLDLDLLGGGLDQFLNFFSASLGCPSALRSRMGAVEQEPTRISTWKGIVVFLSTALCIARA